MNVIIRSTISKLKNEERIFHSEDDLKFSFSFAIKELLPDDYNIRLEKPEDIQMLDRNNVTKIARAPIDIILPRNNGESIPIELKYRTQKLDIIHHGESYHLAAHGATDVGRFSIRKDIYRIEQFLINNSQSKHGYVIVITNDTEYLTDISNKKKLDAHFSIHQDAVLNKKDRSWNYSAIDNNKYEFIVDENIWKYKNGTRKELHWTCRADCFFILDLTT